MYIPLAYISHLKSILFLLEVCLGSVNSGRPLDQVANLL